MDSKELIRKYLEFFKAKKHAVIKSASLIPEHDPSVLFTTAGMHPLVPFLLGQPHPLGKRLVNIQKCIRTVDIDSVGDSYHHTFFEMMGNWSLGDYFKKEAIEWSFELATKILGLDKERLAVSVFSGNKSFPKDEESVKIWKALGIKEERIAYLEDNWWEHPSNNTPCGPCTEMFYWKDNEEKAPKKFDPSDNRWVEIWNDVLMNFTKIAPEKYVESKQKNIDNGRGLERVLAVVNGFDDNYLIDIWLPLIKKIEKISGIKYEGNEKSMRIIADHVKASVFILADGMAPGNVDQGYVLRRLIRRAIRHGKLLGIEKEFLSELAVIVVDMYKERYDELARNKDFIISELKKEDDKFRKTLEKGLHEFEKIAKDKISGKDAFLLFQSYGFPFELTKELAVEKKIKVDEKGFDEEFKNHQELSRVGAEKKFKGGLGDTSEMSIKLHTATHLLNEALRTVVSKNISQKGSNITPERLRFDFNLDRKMTPEEIKKVEEIVNKKIKEAILVKREEMSVEQAKKKGAQAEFGAKYGEKVSVYSINDFSVEICAGPHVKNTSELGTFKIIKEESVAAGVRRIKAVLS
jgi:alanyl-tRNA synthetase